MIPRLVAVAALWASTSAAAWPSEVTRVEAALASTDLETRRQAARALGELPAPAILRLGVPSLSDADPVVRVGALEALVEARAPGLGRRVEAWLSDPDVGPRRAAARVLSRYPVDEAAPALGRSLSDPDASVRIAAARALGATRARGAAISLVGRLDDSDPEVRRAVVRALSRLRDPGSVIPLVGKLQDPRASVRSAVVVALGAIGDPRVATALTLSLRDADEGVRIAALGVLAALRATPSVPAIVSLLALERRPAVRREALLALGAIGAEQGLDALMDALAEDDPSEESVVRAALARAGERAQPRLEACLTTLSTGRLADGAALALGEMKARGAALAITTALRRGAVRPLAALRALAASEESEGLPVVLERLGATDPWERGAAIEAAGRLLHPSTPDGRAVEPLVRALDLAGPRSGERRALVNLLGRTGSPRALPSLLPLAERASDPALRLAAVRALGLVGEAGQDGVLLRALDDPDGDLRLAAAMSLSRTAGPATASALLHRLAVAADQDRGAVGVALSGALVSGTDASRVHAARLLPQVGGAAADALVEALGRIPGARGSAPLVARLEQRPEPALRAKIAEALGAHSEARSTLVRLLADPAARVRANAAWALGLAGGAESASPLLGAMRDRDAAVAANAATAYGRLASRGSSPREAVCSALGDARAAVRLGALRAVLESGARCLVAELSALLGTDRSEAVRGEAARLAALRATDPGHAKDAPSLREALRSCQEDDPSSRVAAACRAALEGGIPVLVATARTAPLSVYVVPESASEPVPDAPFGLVLADGSVRFGTSDRRGSVFEAHAPEGPLRLTQPAYSLP